MAIQLDNIWRHEHNYQHCFGPVSIYVMNVPNLFSPYEEYWIMNKNIDKFSNIILWYSPQMHMFIARYCDLLNVVISCDGCERMAPWHRYRCLQCMDMDLCKTCFLSECSLSAAANVTLGRMHQCSRSVIEHALLQAVPSLRAMRTIMRWSTWNTLVTTARASS